jgi:hypothetical protein
MAFNIEVAINHLYTLVTWVEKCHTSKMYSRRMIGWQSITTDIWEILQRAVSVLLLQGAQRVLIMLIMDLRH